jgi:hypothetical protein
MPKEKAFIAVFTLSQSRYRLTQRRSINLSAMASRACLQSLSCDEAQFAPVFLRSHWNVRTKVIRGCSRKKLTISNCVDQIAWVGRSSELETFRTQANE